MANIHEIVWVPALVMMSFTQPLYKVDFALISDTKVFVNCTYDLQQFNCTDYNDNSIVTPYDGEMATFMDYIQKEMIAIGLCTSYVYIYSSIIAVALIVARLIGLMRSGNNPSVACSDHTNRPIQHLYFVIPLVRSVYDRQSMCRSRSWCF